MVKHHFWRVTQKEGGAAIIDILNIVASEAAMDCFRFSLPSILVDMTRNRCLNFCGARMMFLEHFNPSQRFLLENHFGSSSQIGCNKKSAVDHQTENHLSLTPRFHPFLRLGYRWQSQGHTWVRNVVMLSKRYQGKSCCTNLLLFQEL